MKAEGPPPGCRAGTRRLLALLALVLAASLWSGGAARALSPEEQSKAELFAANNSLFVLLHEMAHLLVDQLRLPVLGREEDAADNIATWMMLSRGTEEADRAIADAAYGWLLSGIAYGEQFDKADFYNEHNLDQQRAYQIVCMMVGSNATTFARIADDYEMDRYRQEKCDLEYDKLERSISRTIGEHIRANSGGTEVKITYHGVSGKLKPIAEAFQRSGVFEQIAAQVKSSYALSYPVSLRAKRCGEPNAFYDSTRVEIIYCYEFMEDMLKLIADDMPKPVGQQSAGPRRGLSGPGLGSTR